MDILSYIPASAESKTFAKALCTIANIRFQKISGQPIVAEHRMVAMSLIMIVEAVSFLRTIGIQQGRIQIKQHVFWFPDGINDISHH